MNKNKENTHYREEFFMNSEMLISIYDKNLNLIDANPAFLKAFYFKLKDIVGKNINEISPDCKPSGRYAIYEDIIRTGNTYVYDQIRLHPSLGSIYIRLTAFKVGDGLGVSCKDITDLIETIEDLETLVYKISHDIRAPICTTLGLVSLAEDDLKHNGTAISYLKMIKEQTENMDQAVARLREVSLIRQSKKRIERIDFDEMIAPIMDSFSDLFRFDKIRFEKSITVTESFHSDKSLVNQILFNLLHNAVKFQDPNKTDPYIEVIITNMDDGVNIQVKDNGIGIAESAQKDVFKMFFRVSTLESGAGLGLYTVKQCVNKLKGKIFMLSKLDEGTRFSLFLPNAD